MISKCICRTKQKKRVSSMSKLANKTSDICVSLKRCILKICFDFNSALQWFPIYEKPITHRQIWLPVGTPSVRCIQTLWSVCAATIQRVEPFEPTSLLMRNFGAREEWNVSKNDQETYFASTMHFAWAQGNGWKWIFSFGPPSMISANNFSSQ